MNAEAVAMATEKAALAAEAERVVATVEHFGGKRYDFSRYSQFNGPPWPDETEARIITVAMWLFWQIDECESELKWNTVPASVRLWYRREVAWERCAGWL